MLPSFRRLHAPLLLHFQTVATGRLTALVCHVAGDAHVQARCRLLPNQSRQSLWTQTANRHLIAKGPILGFTRPSIGRRSRCRYRCCYYCLWRETTPRAEASSPRKAGFATQALSSELRASHWSRIFGIQELQLPLSGPPGVVGVASELFCSPLGLCRHCCWPCCCCCCCLGWTASVASITAADGSIRSRRVADPSVGKERWIFNHARRDDLNTQPTSHHYFVIQ
ncbi:uncharacterized protein LOC117150167 isoform X2 [Drosophila mauritiana]|uniref:Uncharacterized protein LOC117150167 isoform X2 n=1 Tax=Drosophila mauritiana TaxID=7226 RepID=A0A6P8LE15_DROMA|nr:uncharacterized protein LOC117150167 isoform X2 [Drosophila mauritiana]